MNIYDDVCGSGIESGLAASFSSAFQEFGDYFHIEKDTYYSEINCEDMDAFPILGDLGT